jgi:hypothetical protein
MTVFMTALAFSAMIVIWWLPVRRWLRLACQLAAAGLLVLAHAARPRLPISEVAGDILNLTALAVLIALIVAEFAYDPSQRRSRREHNR